MPLSPDTDPDALTQEPLRCVIVVNQACRRARLPTPRWWSRSPSVNDTRRWSARKQQIGATPSAFRAAVCVHPLDRET